MRRVVLVLADGLRPDAITPTYMPSLDALARTYTLLWWFGLEVPAAYEGRVLTQAFTRTSDPVAAVV
jgi:hypothetical protein